MIGRILALLALVASVLWGDWWISLFSALVFLVLFPVPLELVFIALWIDLVYGAGFAGQFPYFFVTIGASVAVFVSLALRKFIFIHGPLSKKEKRYFRN